MVKMLNSKFFKEKKIIYSFLFLLSLITAIYYSLLLNNVIGKNHVTSIIQKQVLSYEKSMKNSVFEYLHSVKNRASHDFLISGSPSNPEFELFLYKRDSLKSWTTTKFYIPLKVLLHSHQPIYDDNVGTYFFIIDSIKDKKLVSILPIVQKVPLKNEYLKKNHCFESEFIQRFSITVDKKENKIYNKAGQYLFSLDFNQRQELTSIQILLLFGLISIILILFYLLIFEFVSEYVKNDHYGLLILILLSLILRVFMIYFNEPWIIYQTDLFQPNIYASSSFFFGTLGDAIFSSLVLLLIGLYVLKGAITKSQIPTYSNLSIMIIYSLISLVNLLFGLYSLIYNSKIPTNLVDISSLNLYSFLGYILVGIQLMSLIISIKFIESLLNLYKNKFYKILFLIILFILLSIVSLLFDKDFVWIIVGILFIIVIQIFIRKDKNNNIYNSQIISIIVLSFVINIYINNANHRSEDLKNKAILLQLANNQDPEFEYQFSLIESQLYKDTLLHNILSVDTPQYSEIENYILQKYFSTEGIKKKYDVQITLCNQYNKLNIKSENITISCSQYFLQNLIAFGKLTSLSKNLYRLELGSGQINYLGLARFIIQNQYDINEYTLYFEVNSKLKRKGFTKILSEKGSDPFDKLGKLSFGHYFRDTLIESYGKYVFPVYKKDQNHIVGDFKSADKNGFHHLIYYSENGQKYILSREIVDLVGIMASFIYLLFYFVLIAVFIICLTDVKYILSYINNSFKVRVQLSVFLLLITTFILISVLSVIKIVKLSDEKNMQNVAELTRILKAEFETKSKNFAVNDPQYIDNLDRLVLKFSKIFDTDINIFANNGRLLSTTRPELYRNKLKSELISLNAIKSITKDNYFSFIEKEKIGTFEFYSSYTTIKCSDQSIIGYLNIPYFAKQDDLSNEISSFISTLINVYALITFISLILAIIISRYISRPLNILSDKMSKIQLGGKNEKILWKKKDEVGKLIYEYNRMLDALKESADKLAVSERSIAWTEMAKQVAHEIRNPLTPMKLSVQYLQKTWVESPGQFQQRLNSFSDTMISQINTLNDIANSFSEFAKMPDMIKGIIDPIEIVENVYSLFNRETDIKFILITDEIFQSKRPKIFVNEGYFIRVLNNLIKNAIQAVEKSVEPQVLIKLRVSDKFFILEIIDNGCGIEKTNYDKIFSPYFTTKSGGTGLGLAMSKNIIQDFGGKIEFDSDVLNGTTFRIYLPLK